MPVYMIRAGENGPVKIGHSESPDIRLLQLQVSHWEPLRILRLFRGGEQEETQLHLRFRDLYIRGEWHHFSRLMLADVGLEEIVAVKPEPPHTKNFSFVSVGQRVALARRDLGITQRALASIIKVSPAGIAHWEKGNKGVRADRLLPLADALSVPIEWLIKGSSPPAEEAA